MPAGGHDRPPQSHRAHRCCRCQSPGDQPAQSPPCQNPFESCGGRGRPRPPEAFPGPVPGEAAVWCSRTVLSSRPRCGAPGGAQGARRGGGGQEEGDGPACPPGDPQPSSPSAAQPRPPQTPSSRTPCSVDTLCIYFTTPLILCVVTCVNTISSLTQTSYCLYIKISYILYIYKNTLFSIFV